MSCLEAARVWMSWPQNFKQHDTSRVHFHVLPFHSLVPSQRFPAALGTIVIVGTLEGYLWRKHAMHIAIKLSLVKLPPTMATHLVRDYQTLLLSCVLFSYPVNPGSHS